MDLFIGDTISYLSLMCKLNGELHTHQRNVCYKARPHQINLLFHKPDRPRILCHVTLHAGTQLLLQSSITCRKMTSGSLSKCFHEMANRRRILVCKKVFKCDWSTTDIEVLETVSKKWVCPFYMPTDLRSTEGWSVKRLIDLKWP